MKAKNIKTIIGLCILMCCGLQYVNAQKVKIFRGVIVDRDTIANIPLNNVYILGFKEGTSNKEKRRKTRLVNNILKVYPYARTAAQVLEKYDKMLVGLPEKEQKALMKEAEKNLRKQYLGDIEKMTFTQGIILLKLVDRETGKTTYKIVDELRGSFQAFFYQSIARLFKYNLKNNYDPKGKDKEIEQIVRMIEEGEFN
ncbi:MAG: DUF4294 domain-containing protein [Bacteroidales bacterium]|jgi:hypothetical protein|nr:DUF4294 domain-containing protein [Bacteroidales bacterium]